MRSALPLTSTNTSVDLDVVPVDFWGEVPQQLQGIRVVVGIDVQATGEHLSS